jgi:hypothetical protein
LTISKLVPTFAAMYFKQSIRTNPSTGEPGGYFRLVESYRTVDGKVCHRTLLNVGFMEGVEPEDLNRIQKLLNHKCMRLDNELFTVDYQKESPLVRKWFEVLYSRLVTEKKIDVPGLTASTPSRSSGSDWHTIDMNSLRHREVQEIGCEWLCYQALEQLGVGSFLSEQADWTNDDVRLALTHIISRAVYPASELKTSRWIRENSAVCELTHFPAEQITKDRLYGISDGLYALKDPLESYLSHQTNELFDIQDKIIIYDLTNTYFEGVKRGSDLACFGRSKEKRSDAKLVVLGLVINQFGFIKYSSIFQGNISDPATLESIIKHLRARTSTRETKGLVVIDAGIATKENLEKIRSEGFDYLCVTRSRMKDYEIVADSHPLTVMDNRGRKIHLQKVTPAKSSEEGNEYYLKVESLTKQKKELSMNNRFRDGYLKGLAVISGSLSKKRGTKVEEKVHERVGRLKQKYPSIHKYYQIDYQVEETLAEKKKPARRIVTSITWKLKDEVDMNQRCGIYFLGTSLKDENRILWDSYNTIREVESTIKVLKTDLDMRPIFHQKDERTMAHLHLALMAYWVVNTVRYQLKEKGIKHSWSEIVRIMNTQKAVTTTAQNNCEQIIKIRRCSEPNEKVKTIYQALNYKSEPFKKKKVVVHKSELENFESDCFRTFQRE